MMTVFQAGLSSCLKNGEYYTFMKWVEENIAGLEAEISSALPSAKGFIPLKWRWVTERTFGTFNFFRRLDKDYEKTTESQES